MLSCTHSLYDWYKLFQKQLIATNFTILVSKVGIASKGRLLFTFKILKLFNSSIRAMLIFTPNSQAILCATMPTIIVFIAL